MTDSIHHTRPSLHVADGTATFVDPEGRAFTATGVDVREGDNVAMVLDIHGRWFAVERDGETTRYPMRHGNDPHLSELMTVMTWSNPILPGETGDPS